MNQWTAKCSGWAGVFTIALAAASFFAATPATLSQTVDASITAKEGQFVPCTQAQAAGCNHPTPTKSSSLTQQSLAVTPQPTSLVSPEKDAAISDLLLGLCYFGLPIGIGLAIWVFDQHRTQKLSELQAQIDLLERIWGQTPQH